MKKLLTSICIVILTVFLAQTGFAQKTSQQVPTTQAQEDQRKLYLADSLVKVREIRAKETKRTLNEAKAEYDAAKKKYDEAKQAHKQATSAVSEAKRSQKMELKAQKARQKAEDQASKAKSAAIKSGDEKE